MSNKILAIDIDGCLTGNEYECKLYSKYLDKEVTPKDLVGFDLTSSFGLTIEEENNFWDYYLEDYFLNADIDKISVKNIIDIAENYDEVIILTSRFSDFEEITLNWLNKIKNLGLNFNKLVCTDEVDKTTYLEDLKINALIEDNGGLTDKLHFSHPQITTYLVDRQYNKSNKSTYRIKSNHILV